MNKNIVFMSLLSLMMQLHAEEYQFGVSRDHKQNGPRSLNNRLRDVKEQDYLTDEELRLTHENFQQRSQDNNQDLRQQKSQLIVSTQLKEHNAELSLLAQLQQFYMRFLAFLTGK